MSPMTDPLHENRTVFAVWSPNMATAIDAINLIGCAHLLRQMVPSMGVHEGYWLLFKNDSWLKAEWAKIFPDARTLP